MADTDLLFQRPPVPTPGAVDLVFGEDAVVVQNGTISLSLPGLTVAARAGRPNDATLAAALPTLTFQADADTFPTLVYDATVAMTLPALSVSVRASAPNDATLVATLPGLAFASVADFDSNTERPTVGATRTLHTEADDLRTGVQTAAQSGISLRPGETTCHQIALPLPAGVQAGHEDGVRLRSVTLAAHDATIGVRSSVGFTHQDGLRDRRPAVNTRHQEAIRVRASVRTAHQERYRDRRPVIRTRHQGGLPLRHQALTAASKGTPFVLRRQHRHQEAMRPPAGMYVAPPTPGPDPCYTPDAHLLFASAFGATPSLLFICDNHTDPPDPNPGLVVVPVRSCYLVLNDVSLKRVAGSVLLKATAMSFNIDVDSWTWSFSASLPASDLEAVEPVAGVPVELEAEINGSVYRVIVEKISTERVFGNTSIRVSGRGKSALLASPYSPVLTFGNTAARTAQQLMADVLTENAIPLDWTVDWNVGDWLVPAGVFGMQGSRMDALVAIAGAAGAYIQPHPTAQELIVNARYPSLPWEWGTVTPDFELPSAVTTREGIEFVEKPRYNRVFVSGQHPDSRLVRVTRAGSDGGLLAPMVTEALTTAVAAGRQRGAAVLADTGRQAIVGLGLPVLSETGVITPGKFVRYVDGATSRLGIVRATSVEVSGGGANVRQSITLETHPV